MGNLKNRAKEILQQFRQNLSTNSAKIFAKIHAQNRIANAVQNFLNHPNILASKAFIKKEFLHIFRDIRTVMILVLMPLVQILLFGFALSSEVRNVRFALLDFANDSNTQKIIAHLSQNPHFILHQNLIAQDFGNDFSRAFKSGDIDFLLVFPPDFSANLHSGVRPAQVQIILDASDANRASTINIFVSNIIQSAFASNIARSPNLDSAQNLSISSTMLFNPQGKSAPNFVPGLLGLVLMLICAMMTSISIVREKEQGSMEVLLISPLKPSLVIISKLIPYFLLSFGILVLVLVVCVFVLDLAIVGSLTLLIAFCLLYLFLALCIGLMVSNLAKTQVVAMLVCAMLFMMPVMMFSGMIFPVESMPKILQYFSDIIPAKWFIMGVKKIMIEGLSVSYILKEGVILCAMLAIVLGISLKTYKVRL